MSSSHSDPVKLPWQQGSKEQNLKEAEIGKVSLDLSLSSTLDHFLRLAERCAEQGKITPKEYANLVDQCGNLKKNLFKIGDQKVMERKISMEPKGRILKP